MNFVAFLQMTDWSYIILHSSITTCPVNYEWNQYNVVTRLHDKDSTK